MSTTPIDNARRVGEGSGKSITPVDRARQPVQHGAKAPEDEPAKVADSVHETVRLTEVAEQAALRADEQLILELKMAIAKGEFRVDSQRLAARLVADALAHDDGM